MTNDLKASIAGIIGGIFAILTAFHVVVPATLSNEQTTGIIAGILATVVGYVSAKHPTPPTA